MATLMDATIFFTCYKLLLYNWTKIEKFGSAKFDADKFRAEANI